MLVNTKIRNTWDILTTKTPASMLFIIIALLITCLFGINAQAQNLVSVPFGNGFIGNNGGNAVSDNSYYLTGPQGIGWSNIQFAQTTNSEVFVAQGNDIVGMVLITDFNGIQHSIDGFIKWRTPSGNNPHTMVFQPSSGSFELATNGAYSMNNYIVDATKYIGLTQLGEVLTINPHPGAVSGNASTSGLLEALNTIYASLPRLSVSGTTIMESDGVALIEVNMNESSSEMITVNLVTENQSAFSTQDYLALDTTLTFAPGQQSKSISIPIVVDVIPEASEYFYLVLRNAVNASVAKSLDSVIILESALPVEFLGMKYECTDLGGVLSWNTASELNTSFYKVEISEDGEEWETVSVVLAKGTTNEESFYTTTVRTKCPSNVYYLRLMQGDMDGKTKTLGSISIEGCEFNEAVLVYPNPTKGELKVSIHFMEDAEVLVEFVNNKGITMHSESRSCYQGRQTLAFDLNDLMNGRYQMVISYDGYRYRESVLLLK